MKKAKAKRVLLSLVACVLSFVLLEAGLRIYFAFKIGPDMLFGRTSARNRTFTALDHDKKCAGYSKYYPHQTRNDFDPDTGKPFAVTINSAGFRGRDFNAHKPPGVTRIVTLGASSTFGFHDRDNETYPAYLEEILNSQAAEGGRFEVINLGIPHLVSEQNVELFQAEALPLKPDVVTFYEGLNDCAVERVDALRKGLARVSLGRAVLHWLRDRSLLVACLDDMRQKMKRNKETCSKADLERDGRAASRRFLGNLERIRDECRQRGILFVVGNQQMKSNLIPREQLKGMTYQEEAERVQAMFTESGELKGAARDFIIHRSLMADLAEWAAANGVPLADVIHALDQDRETLTTKVHINAAGNRIVAGEFARVIRAQLETRQAE
jgi:lysophospholipase L1-like esterase